MVGFILKRFATGLLVLISIVVLVSSIIYLTPVDPTRLTFGQRADDQTVLQKQQELGLDQPLSTQMLYYLTDVSPLAVVSADRITFIKNVMFNINMGSHHFLIKKPYLRTSFQSGRSVSALLKATIPKTIILALAAFLLATVVGITLGILAALAQDTLWDNLIVFVSTIGISVPSYVAAIFCALIFGYLLAPYTGLNMQGSIFEINNIGDDVVVWKNLILPAIALGVRPISIVVQLTRSSMLDVLEANYIKTARSKGVQYTQIIKKHALRNALNPIITSLSGWLASLLAGAFFVEKVFNYKGVGELTINGLINYDIPVILACVIFIASVFVIMNIVTDIVYVLIDPKVKVD